LADGLKQVIVVRTDIGMGKGKVAAQVAHASLSAVEEAMRRRSDWVQEWKAEGQPKVVLKCSSEDELRDMQKKAGAAGLPSALVEDRGLTQVDPGTVTCLAIGPAPDERVDAITGRLKLL
jgi:PTH2 family peptidyl-tRNA hydrolase